MSMVIDASITMAWYFADASSSETDALLDRVAESGAIAPGLWRLEVANAFQSAVGAGQIDAIYRDASLVELGFLPITIDSGTSDYAWGATLRLAERFSLSTYDAAYLELAQRLSLPLASLDKTLRQAAEALSIELLGVA